MGGDSTSSKARQDGSHGKACVAQFAGSRPRLNTPHLTRQYRLFRRPHRQSMEKMFA